MKNLANALPMSESVQRRRSLVSTALDTFRGWGYRDIAIPMLEHVEVRPEILKIHDVNRTFRLVDAEGNLQMLRSDVTPAVAKLLAPVLADVPLPMRLCYASRVVRSERAFARRQGETYQIGVELLGGAGAVYDTEVILVAMQTLDALGVDDYQINLGDVSVFKRLLQLTGLPKARRAQIREAVVQRDPHAVADVLHRLGTRQNVADAIVALTMLRGGPDQVARIRSLLPHDGPLRMALAHLESVVATVRQVSGSDRMQIALGEIEGPAYHTDMVFRIVSEGIGREIGGGGRYDDVLGLFGPAAPAVGFALRSDAVLEVLHPEGESIPAVAASHVVRVDGDDPVAGLREAWVRRQEGLPARVLEKRSPPTSGSLLAALQVGRPADG
jgi:ATP phosphoribosyltransferase regulatory subunit